MSSSTAIQLDSRVTSRKLAETGTVHVVRKKGVEKSTPDKILVAARELFSTRGYRDVRIADIADRAQVNLALINYHFGSKEALFEEIFRAESAEISRLRKAGLEHLRGSKRKLRLEEIIKAYLAPVFDHVFDEDNGSMFILFTSAMFSLEISDEVKYRIVQNLWRTDVEFIETIQECRPDLSRDTIVWRFFSMIGSYSYLMGQANPIGMDRMSNGRCDPHSKAQAIRQITSYAIAGFAAKEPD